MKLIKSVTLNSYLILFLSTSMNLWAMENGAHNFNQGNEKTDQEADLYQGHEREKPDALLLKTVKECIGIGSKEDYQPKKIDIAKMSPELRETVLASAKIEMNSLNNILDENHTFNVNMQIDGGVSYQCTLNKKNANRYIKLTKLGPIEEVYDKESAIKFERFIKILKKTYVDLVSLLGTETIAQTKIKYKRVSLSDSDDYEEIKETREVPIRRIQDKIQESIYINIVRDLLKLNQNIDGNIPLEIFVMEESATYYDLVLPSEKFKDILAIRDNYEQEFYKKYYKKDAGGKNLLGDTGNSKGNLVYSPNFLIDFLLDSVTKNDAVLEIGAARGLDTFKILSSGAHVTALDLSAKALKQLKKKTPHNLQKN